MSIKIRFSDSCSGPRCELIEHMWINFKALWVEKKKVFVTCTPKVKFSKRANAVESAPFPPSCEKDYFLLVTLGAKVTFKIFKALICNIHVLYITWINYNITCIIYYMYIWYTLYQICQTRVGGFLRTALWNDLVWYFVTNAKNKKYNN